MIIIIIVISLLASQNAKLIAEGEPTQPAYRSDKTETQKNKNEGRMRKERRARKMRRVSQGCDKVDT